jgi:hypothetical protein
MEQDTTIEFKGDHIVIDHGEEFEITEESMQAMWGQLSKVCREYDCGRLLILGNAPVRRMDTINAFASGTRAAEIYPDLWIALCFVDYEPDEVSDLFATAARNRGARVKFFRERERALRWLGVKGE